MLLESVSSHLKSFRTHLFLGEKWGGEGILESAKFWGFLFVTGRGGGGQRPV